MTHPAVGGRHLLEHLIGVRLRYKLRSDGTYCLYSVAEDTEDDQGSPIPETNNRQPASAWNERDWVRPQAVPVHAEPDV